MFDSVEAALYWAFRLLAIPVFARPWLIYAKPGGLLPLKTLSTLTGLSEYEKRGEAALIAYLVDGLPVPQSWYAYVKFGASQAHLDSLAACLESNTRANHFQVRTAILRYCGIPVRGRPPRIERQIFDELDRLHSVLIGALEPEFSRRGLT